MLDATAKVFQDDGLPIYAMTQAKPFEMRYSTVKRDSGRNRQ